MRIKNAVVHGDLCIAWIDATHARLTQDLRFTWDDDEGPQEFIALDGTKINGADVPWFFWWFIPPWGVLNLGMVIHDIAFKMRFKIKGKKGEERISRKYADQLLFCFSRASGCDPLRAYAARYVVRWFGEAKWDHHDEEFRDPKLWSPDAPPALHEAQDRADVGGDDVGLVLDAVEVARPTVIAHERRGADHKFADGDDAAEVLDLALGHTG